MLKLACQEQLLPGDDLVAKFDFARRAGFDGIELRAKGDGHFTGRLPELRAAVRAGVVMKTVCPETDHFIGDFDADQRRDAIAQIRTQLSVIAEIGGEGMLTPASWGMFSLRLPPFAPPRTAEDDRKVLLEALIPLAEHAAREGVWLALEALNRYEDYMINRLDQVVGLAQEVRAATGSDPSGPAPTSSTSTSRRTTWRRPSSRPAPYIAHVHVDDSNRMQPGTGHLDFAGAFRALRAIDYDGWHTLECRLRGDPETALPATAAFLRQFALARCATRSSSSRTRTGSAARCAGCVRCWTDRWRGCSAACTSCPSTGPTTARTPASTPTTTWPSTRAWAHGTTWRRWRGATTSPQT